MHLFKLLPKELRYLIGYNLEYNEIKNKLLDLFVDDLFWRQKYLYETKALENYIQKNYPDRDSNFWKEYIVSREYLRDHELNVLLQDFLNHYHGQWTKYQEVKATNSDDPMVDSILTYYLVGFYLRFNIDHLFEDILEVRIDLYDLFDDGYLKLENAAETLLTQEQVEELNEYVDERFILDRFTITFPIDYKGTDIETRNYENEGWVSIRKILKKISEYYSELLSIEETTRYRKLYPDSDIYASKNTRSDVLIGRGGIRSMLYLSFDGENFMVDLDWTQ